MSEQLDVLASKLRTLRDEWGEGVARKALEQQAAAFTAAERARLEALVFLDVQSASSAGGDTIRTAENTTAGSASVSGEGRVIGATLGVNQGTVQLFFGGKPPEDGAHLLNAYLDSLCERYRPLALGRLLIRERRGDERAAAPALPLRAVYTALATDARLPRERFELTGEELEQALEAANPNLLPPDRLRLPIADLEGVSELVQTRGGAPSRSLPELYRKLRQSSPRISRDQKRDRITGQWYEPELAVETLAQPRSRVVLLGDPGSGKSTVLRYLVLCIAEALLAGATEAPADLRGWAGQPLPVPIFCPLGPVAKELDDNPRADRDRLVSELLRPLYGVGSLREGLRETLLRAWTGGAVLLCFDGLDEVSGTVEPTQDGLLSRRERLAEAIRQLTQELGASRIVITCRTSPYEQDRAWQLSSPWQTRRIESFAFGQMRFFVEQWYAQSCTAEGAKLTEAEAQVKAGELLRAIPAQPSLRDICASPLLLTMVVLLHFNQKQLPDERAEVYEELVGLLLDRWEWVRSSEKEHVALIPFGERLGLPQLRARDLRAALNQIAYEAHCHAQDGRGVIAEQLIYDLLEPRFRNAINSVRPELVKKAEWTAKVETFLDLLVRESGLVQPDDDKTYVLPHLTFEEYLAACHLAEQEDVEEAYARWREGGDRWREPLLLLMGCLRLQSKHKLAFDWLELLLDDVVGREEKLAAQIQRDAVLAAFCYRDLGGRRAMQDRWHSRKVDMLEERIRMGLLNVLASPEPDTIAALRLEAGRALGSLDDPRFPIEVPQWQTELKRRNELFSEPAGYFCYVPGGSYQIGGWVPDETSVPVVLKPFWIARLPITVAQYALFVMEGYTSGAERWWLPKGWQHVVEREGRRAPYEWGQMGFDGANQPVVALTRYEATAFCAWLSEQLTELLPAGYILRLPTEAEWEVAASYNPNTERRPYPWGSEPPTPERAVYDKVRLNEPAPVGCFISGIAACGALDMAGNVWEMCVGNYNAHPSVIYQLNTYSKNELVSWRGGSWFFDETFLHCSARNSLHFKNRSNGFRVVLAPVIGSSY